MVPQAVANTVYAFGKLERAPGPEAWAALELAVVRVARVMKSQDAANTFWAFSKLEKAPGPETWAALELAAVRVAREMNSQDAANIFWAFGKRVRSLFTGAGSEAGRQGVSASKAGGVSGEGIETSGRW